MIDFIAKQQLGKANEMQEKFRRNGLEVDREGVTALADVMKGRRGIVLLEDQVEVFERCVALLGGEGREESWKVLQSPFPNVEMWLQYFLPKVGERTVGTGKTVGIVDTCAEEVAAWVMDYNNNEGSRLSREEGNPARLALRKEARENEGTFATVKKAPFPLEPREFVFRQIWKTEEGKATIVFESVDDKVDYGMSLRKTRARTRGLWVLEDLPSHGGAKQCRATFTLQIGERGASKARMNTVRLTGNRHITCK